MKWFKRKPKNRRFERDHVLDVKMRSQHTRTLRVRFAATTCSIVLGAGLTVFGLWRGSEWLLEEYVFKNPTFSIRSIDIQTDGIIPIQQLRTWSGVKEGENLLAIDLLRIRRDLELQPLIQSAAVERVLPQSLRIRVVEREPIAQITGFQAVATDRIQSSTFYLDEAGYVMPPLAVLDAGSAAAFADLPSINGIIGTELRPGKQVESPQIHAALRFISSFDRSPMANLASLSFIDLSSPQVLQVHTRQGSEITVSLDSPDRVLRRWRSVFDFASQTRRAIASLDLSVTNNSPARWQEASSSPPAQAKPKKPSRYRKKHV